MMIRLSSLYRLGAILILGLLVASCGEREEVKWRIGFSQVTTAEPWRVLFNREMRAEAAKYPGLELLIADGQDRTEKQVADIEAFIRQGVDVILVSPKESVGLSGVLERAEVANIPVIVLDRDVEQGAYTQFIGGDNVEIGRLAGTYAVEKLGGAGAASGQIVEIWGGMGSTPAHERHKGFDEMISAEPDIVRVVGRQDGDWKQDRAYNIMAAAMRAHPRIDLVYAHNDPMAYGAYLAAQDAGRADDIIFLGIDAIPTEGGMWVKKGFLTATFIYKTPGAEAIRQAMHLLNGKEIEERIILPTEVVDRENADAFLARHGLE